MKNLKFGIVIILFLLAGKAGAQCVTAGPAQTICQGGSTDPLGGSFGDDATSGEWSSDSGGTFSNNSGDTPGDAIWSPPNSFSGIAFLTLTAIGGTCDGVTVTTTITVNPEVEADVTISASPSGDICAGTSVTFTAIPVNVVSPLYQWKVNGFDEGGDSPAFSSSDLVDGDLVTVQISSTESCVTGLPATSNQLVMQVTSPVTPSVSISVSPSSTICDGTSVTFTASSTNGGTPIYQWKVNGSDVGSGPTYSSSDLNDNDVVTVEMTSSLTCVMNSQATSNQIVMEVNPTVEAGVTITANPVGPVCSGNQVTFTAIPVNGGTPSYAWRVNGAPAGTNSPTFVSTTLANNDVVTVRMSSTALCVTGSPATSNAITMVVTTPGTAGVGVSAAPVGPVCEGTMVTFTAIPVNGGSPTYSWRLNGVVVGTNPTYATSAMNDNDVVTVMMTSSLTCVSGSPATSNPLTMTVNPTLPANVTISASPVGSVCAGTPVTFTAIPVNGGTPVYDWRVNGAPAGTNSSTFVSTTLANNDVVTVSMTSNAQCVTGSPAISNGITMAITPSVPVGVSIAASPAGPVCAGTSVTFTATSVNGGVLPSFQWKVNGADVGTDSPSFTSSTLSNNNIVTVVLTSSIACVSGNPSTSNPITMTVNSLPVPILTSSDPDRRICTGTSVIFTAGGGDNYNFLIDNVSQQNSALNTFTSTTLQNGDRVSVEVRNTAGCTTLSSELEMIVYTPPFIEISTSPACSNDLLVYSFSVRVVGPGTVTTSSGVLTNQGNNIWQVSGVLSGVNVTVSAIYFGCENSFVITAPDCSCPVVQPPVSGGGKTYCAGGIIPAVDAIVPSGATVDWYSDPTSGTLLAEGVLSYTPIAPGTFYAQTRNITTLCVSSTRTPVTATANQLPAATLISSDADNTFCIGTSVTFTAGGGTSYNFLVAGVSVQNGDLATFTTSALITGQSVSVIVSSSLGCTAAPVIITNTVLAPPIPTLISSDPDNSICSGTTTTFTATGGTSYNFRVDGLSVQNGAAAAYITTMLADGQVVDVIVTNTAGCTATSAAITNAVFLPPTAGAGTGGNNCGLIFHLNATLSTGTGTWTRVSGPGSATFTPDANSSAATVNVSVYGNYTFRWTVVNGTCTASSDISIVFIQQSAANAGPGGNVCDLDYTFNAMPITSGIGTWTKISGPGNPVFTPDNNQPGATVTVDQFGTYDFAWSVVNSTCSSSDIIRVGFHGPPEVNAGRDTAMCRGGSIQLQSSGSGTVLWTPADHVSNPTIINPVVTPDVTTTFTLSLIDQFGCRNSDEIIVGVRNNTTANAGPDQNIVYVFSTTLDAEPPAEFETGVWSVFSGTGILTDPTEAKTAVESLSPGENRFIWTVSNGFCPLSSDTSNIYVNDFVIPTLITPNMDGRNDYFVISGLFTFGKTELVIFDRRGAKVYSNPDYDNSWDGVNYNNIPLPDDTYFYSLKTANGISFKGYIVIKR